MKPKHSLAIVLAMVLLVPPMSQGQATSRVISFNNVPTNIAPGTLAQTLTLQLWDASTPGTQLYCEDQTLDVVAGPDGVTGVIAFNFGAGVAPPTPCPSGPPELKPGDFVSGQSRFLDVVDTTGVSVLSSGRFGLSAVAFALNPGPQGAPGVVQTVTAGDGSISVAGTAADRLVSIAPNGVTNANVASGALSPAKIAGTAATLGSNSFDGGQSINGNLLVDGGLRVLGNGSVGIGTAVPTRKIQTRTLSNEYSYSQTDGTTELATYLNGVYNSGMIGTVSSHPFQIYTSNAGPVMTLTTGGTNGNVGIGTTTPQQRLDVAGAVRFGSTSSACDPTKRGTIRHVPGAPGVSDKVEMCIKTANEAYVWTTLSRDHHVFPNGAGGSYSNIGTDRAGHARAACESFYGIGNCLVGSCGSFSFYYGAGTLTCNCNKAVGTYEWIFANGGYTQVGQDYGGQTTDVTANSLFVRRKLSPVCDANSWVLTLRHLGIP